MIVGLKCDGCGLWTKVIYDRKHSTLGSPNVDLIAVDNKKPYYCDECEANVTWHETKASIEYNP